MSRLLKKQLFSILETLQEANQAIINLLDRKQIDDLAKLLTDCQEGAIAIGNQIELIYGEGKKSVQGLEAYCETLYHIVEKRNDSFACKKYGMLAETQLGEIKGWMEQEVSHKLEVAFLPYKAAMWDSLESIYLAAKEDNECEVYCVPIPYYDLNKDYSYGELHDEKGDYPVNIEITDWRSYRLEDRKPDIIFIHNPYDDWNMVTSVEPRFFSKRLRHYTDMLVYVPYFVLDEIEEDNKAAIENMKHFCFLPGTVYADKVIVQSEGMKEIYMKEYLHAAEEQWKEVDREQVKKKFVGWGSPKYDKVHDTKKEEIKIPEEWIKTLRKPDGSYKKVILYNTSINSFLAHGNKMLIKMKQVFALFKKKQESIALLWRPHPLLENTLKTMRGEMLEEYRELVNNYIKEGWGIYDDTPDMNSSVALSDAYYGDYSSMMWLYREAHKPVMVQNQDCILNNGNSFSLAMDNIVEYKGKLWFLAMGDNDIYSMEQDSLEAVFVKRIPLDKKKIGDCPQYGKIYIYNDKIFVIPWIADNIAVYDMEMDEIRYIAYEDREPNCGMAFLEGIIKENKLYIIPCSSNYFLIIDMDREEMEKIPILNESEKEGTIAYAWGSIFVEKSKILFTALFHNIIYSFDMESLEIESYQFEGLGNGGAGICGDEENIWIIPRKTDKIFRWDRKRQELSVYRDFPEGYQPGEDWSFHRIWFDDKLYLLPRQANMCIMVDAGNGKMNRVLDVCKDIGNWYDKYMFFSHIWREKEKVRIIETKTGNIYCLDSGGNIYEEHIRNLTETGGKIELDEIIYERYNRTNSLECYADNVMDYTLESEAYTKGYGKYIFNEIRSLEDKL